MGKASWVCGVAVLITAVGTASAKEFPLTFKTIQAEAALAFPGGPGSYGQLFAAKPPELKKEPKAISRHPIYGRLGMNPSAGGTLYRIDESTGDGKGYDTLIVDFNGNDDLTDDAATKRMRESSSDRMESGQPQRATFGPIEAPADKTICGGRPIYFAEMFVFNRPSIVARNDRNLFVGQLRLKAGWYVETTVELDGVKQRIGLFDGDSNLRLGDPWKPQTIRNPDGENWYFMPGDSFLQDLNGSGEFENDRFSSEASPFGPVIYFGAAPYLVVLASDCKSIRVEPCTENLGELKAEPNGGQVRSLALASEKSSGEWQLIQAGVSGGIAKLPPGNYRLYNCILSDKAEGRDPVMVSGFNRGMGKTVRVESGKATALACGAPMEIQVTAQQVGPVGYSPASFMKSKSDCTVRINAVVVGAGNETYSTYATGENLRDTPSKPTFTVTDKAGKAVHSGNLEFG